MALGCDVVTISRRVLRCTRHALVAGTRKEILQEGGVRKRWWSSDEGGEHATERNGEAGGRKKSPSITHVRALRRGRPQD